MKPSERYPAIRAEIPKRFPGIKEPHLTERALLQLLDELHPEPAAPKGPPPLPPVTTPKANP